MVDDVEGYIAVDSADTLKRHPFGSFWQHQCVERPPWQWASLQPKDT